MNWLLSLPGIDELETAEDFFRFFNIPYEMAQLQSKHLHIMHLFHQRIVPLALMAETASEAARFAMAKRELQQCYTQFAHQMVKTHSSLGIYERQRPSFIPFSALQKVHSV